MGNEPPLQQQRASERPSWPCRNHLPDGSRPPNLRLGIEHLLVARYATTTVSCVLRGVRCAHRRTCLAFPLDCWKTARCCSCTHWLARPLASTSGSNMPLNCLRNDAGECSPEFQRFRRSERDAASRGLNVRVRKVDGHHAARHGFRSAWRW